MLIAFSLIAISYSAYLEPVLEDTTSCSIVDKRYPKYTIDPSIDPSIDNATPPSLITKMACPEECGRGKEAFR
jgi:hypothetical protein